MPERAWTELARRYGAMHVTPERETLMSEGEGRMLPLTALGKLTPVEFELAFAATDAA